MVNSSWSAIILLLLNAIPSPSFVINVRVGTHEWDIIEAIGYKPRPLAKPMELVWSTPNAQKTSFSVIFWNLQNFTRNSLLFLKALANSSSFELEKKNYTILR